MELQLSILLQKFANPIFDLIAQIFDILGDNGWIFIVIALGLYFIKKYRTCSVFLLFNLLTSAVVGLIAKKLIGRQRPCLAYPELVNCYKEENAFASMPSGHTLMAAAFVFVMCKYFPKQRGYLVALLVVMTISRIYVGAHYLTDVIVAIILGFVIFVIDSVIWQKFLKKWLIKAKII